MEISKTKFGFSMVGTIISTALILIPLTVKRTKKKCKEESDRKLIENDKNFGKILNEIQSMFGDKVKEKDKINYELIDKVKEKDKKIKELVDKVKEKDEKIKELVGNISSDKKDEESKAV